jgi:hypothetical protein
VHGALLDLSPVGLKYACLPPLCYRSIHGRPLANPSMTEKDDAPADIVVVTQTKDGDLRLGTGVNG